MKVATARRGLAGLVAEGLNVRALERALAPGAALQSAITAWPGLAPIDAIRLVAAETAAVGSPVICDVFSGKGHQAVVVSGIVNGEPVLQLLLAAYDAQGVIARLTSFFKFMYPFTSVREQVRRELNDLPQAVWSMPAIAPDDGAYHESIRNFDYAPDLVFNSPVLRTGATPESIAYRVLSHASSVYGVRRWSDFALVSGTKQLRFFNVDIKGQPLWLGNVLTFETKAIKEIVSFSRPWASALALYTRVKARIGEELGGAFFWPDLPDYDAYREQQDRSPQ